MSAWICAFVGVVSAVYAGRFVLELSIFEILLCLLASNLGGMAALLVTLKAGRTPWIHKNFLKGGFRTWTFFLLIYFGVIFLVAEPVRDFHRFSILVFPMILATGFTILAFGPLQDRIVARIQRRARAP